MQALVRSEGSAPPAVTAEPFLEAFLAGRSPQTMDAYRRDLRDFAGFVGVADPARAAEELLGRGAGQANLLAIRYRAALLDRGLSPASVNRKLAALRSLVKMARLAGLVPFSLEVENVRSQAYRDTRGPGLAGYRLMLGAVEARGDAKGARDGAMLHLLFDLGLRRAEVVSLDLSDLDLGAGVVSVLGKGRRERVALTLPDPTRCAIERWLDHRGLEEGPLFLSMDRAGKGSGRLTGRALHQVVQTIGLKVGLNVWPHALRHASITTALDMTGGDVRAVAKFSRHMDIRVLGRYDDNREDMAGAIARLIAA